VGGKGNYVRLADRAKRGQYDLVEPFDYMILGLLPEEGALMGGYYPITVSVSELRKRHFTELPAPKISARLVSMNVQGLVVLAGSGKGQGWQRTQTGKEVYEKWQQQRSA
jgi:hypothetical protein